MQRTLLRPRQSSASCSLGAPIEARIERRIATGPATRSRSSRNHASLLALSVLVGVVAGLATGWPVAAADRRRRRIRASQAVRADVRLGLHRQDRIHRQLDGDAAGHPRGIGRPQPGDRGHGPVEPAAHSGAATTSVRQAERRNAPARRTAAVCRRTRGSLCRPCRVRPSAGRLFTCATHGRSAGGTGRLDQGRGSTAPADRDEPGLRPQRGQDRAGVLGRLRRRTWPFSPIRTWHRSTPLTVSSCWPSSGPCTERD